MDTISRQNFLHKGSVILASVLGIPFLVREEEKTVYFRNIPEVANEFEAGPNVTIIKVTNGNTKNPEVTVKINKSKETQFLLLRNNKKIIKAEVL